MHILNYSLFLFVFLFIFSHETVSRLPQLSAPGRFSVGAPGGTLKAEDN